MSRTYAKRTEREITNSLRCFHQVLTNERRRTARPPTSLLIPAAVALVSPSLSTWANYDSSSVCLARSWSSFKKSYICKNCVDSTGVRQSRVVTCRRCQERNRLLLKPKLDVCVRVPIYGDDMLLAINVPSRATEPRRDRRLKIGMRHSDGMRDDVALLNSCPCALPVANRRPTIDNGRAAYNDNRGLVG